MSRLLLSRIFNVYPFEIYLENHFLKAQHCDALFAHSILFWKMVDLGSKIFLILSQNLPEITEINVNRFKLHTLYNTLIEYPYSSNMQKRVSIRRSKF
jgi:hypothetical protein